VSKAEPAQRGIQNGRLRLNFAKFAASLKLLAFLAQPTDTPCGFYPAVPTASRYR
jgi:hypothetical protein